MSTDSRHRAASAVSLLILVSLAACPGTLEDPARFEVDGSSAVQGAASGCADATPMLFVSRCALAGCHTAKDMASGLDLESANVFGRLAGQMARGRPGVIVDPGGDPSRSVLYLKLGPNPPFGVQMPVAGGKLDAASIACVASWIYEQAALLDSGASETGPPVAE